MNMHKYKYTQICNRMAEGFSRARFTGEVIDLLDRDGEDGGLDDIFFPGSDEEFGFMEEEIGRQEKTLVM